MKMRRSGRGRGGSAPPEGGAAVWSPTTVALVGHRSAGKTSLGELLLQAARVTRVVGSVEEGTSLLDHTAEERKLRMTCGLGTAWLTHRGRDLVLVDTPGSASLAHEQARGIHIADVSAIVVDASAGVELGTERAISQVSGRGSAAFVVVSKIERLESLERTAAEIQNTFRTHRDDVRVVPLHLPVFGEDGSLQGIVDLLADQVLRYDPAGSGAVSPEPIPPVWVGRAHAAREAVAEAVALTDDELLEQYLEDLELPPADLVRGLVRGVSLGRLVPVLLTSAVHHVGAEPLLDALATLAPSPVPPRVRDEDGCVRELRPAEVASAFVAEIVACQHDDEGQPVTWLKVWAGVGDRNAWRACRSAHGGRRLGKPYRIRGPRRATAPVCGPGSLVAVYEDLELPLGTTFTTGPTWHVVGPPPPPAPVAWWVRAPKLDLAVLDEALAALVRTDGGLAVRVDPGCGARLLCGLSEGHLRLAVQRLADRCGQPVSTALPPVAYVEVLAAPVEGVGLHEVRGDHGLVAEFGECQLALVPQSPSLESPVAFVDCATDDEELPPRFRPAVGEGSADALQRGPLAGYPVVGVEVRLTGGSYDMLCSTEEHFRRAGERATREALQHGGTRLLEPWHEVRIDAPQEAVGELIADIATHRGRVVGLEVLGHRAHIVAHCPYRELRTFSSRLETLTGGRGAYVCDPSHHEPVPDNLVGHAIEDSPHRRSC